MKSYFFLILLISLKIVISHCQQNQNQKRLFCLDNKDDVSLLKWSSNSEIKSASMISSLPKGFGDLKALQSNIGNGIWYIEGSTSIAKEIYFKAPTSSYSNGDKSVRLYMKYYLKSPRRISLFPVKAKAADGGPLQLLPISSSEEIKWNEVNFEIDPSESPIQLTAYLGMNQFIIFDKVVLTVDSPLPMDLTQSCKSLLTTTTTTGSGISSSTSRSSSDMIPRSECPTSTMQTVPECKCNCLCNCANGKC